MSDDMSAKLQQLKDMLNDDQMKEKFQSMMSIIPNMQNTEGGSGSSSSGNGFSLSDNEVMISKFMKIMEKRKQFNDPRINLLTAMRPYLSEKRQAKIDSYSKIFSFTQLASLLNDEEL